MKKNKSKRRQRIFALIACVCLVCSMFVVSSHAEDTITDLSGTTWIWNDIPPKLPRVTGYTSYATFNINFTSDRYGDERVYTAFDFTFYGEGNNVYAGLLYSGSQGSYATESGGSAWSDQRYRTIHIIDGTDATNATFIAYLQANATLIPPDPTQDLMSDVGDALSEILTDVGDVAETIVDTPILLIMCIGIPVISVVIGFLARLKDKV